MGKQKENTMRIQPVNWASGAIACAALTFGMSASSVKSVTGRGFAKFTLKQATLTGSPFSEKDLLISLVTALNN